MNGQHDNPIDRARPLMWLRLAALVGLAVSGYLLYLALTGRTAPGCGESAGGCSDILSSPWSKLLGVPVAALAVGAYLIVLSTSIHAGPSSPERHRDGAWRILALVGVAAGASALWFIGVQLVVFRHVCVYCMTAHACSLVIAGVALSRAPIKPAALGLLPAAALALLQLTVSAPAPAPLNDATVFGNLDPHAAPTLGDPDAPFVMALLYDYNCSHCRLAHASIADTVERYDGRLAVVMLPTALDPACNKRVKTPNPMSATSCRLARLALAVWAADPGRFADFDRELMAMIVARGVDGPVPSELIDTVCRALAERLVGADRLEAALDDPRIGVQLDTAAEVYKLAENPRTGRRGVPRVIVAGRAYPFVEDPDALADLLEAAYPGLAGAPADGQ